MYCISRMYTHWGGHSSGESELIAKDKAGNTTCLSNVSTTLKLDESNQYYTLIGDGQTLAQGIYVDIFKTISELTKRGLSYPDKVTGDGWSMSYDDYKKGGENA